MSITIYSQQCGVRKHIGKIVLHCILADWHRCRTAEVEQQEYLVFLVKALHVGKCLINNILPATGIGGYFDFSAVDTAPARSPAESPGACRDFSSSLENDCVAPSIPIRMLLSVIPWARTRR